MVPLYIKYLGAESYGLVGFFGVMQACFQLLDMGLTPTMARETARFNGGAINANSLRSLLRAMEGIFVAGALFVASITVSGADFIAEKWLQVDQLPLVEVRNAVVLMAGVVALRWVGGLYRGVISGFERLVWLGGLNIAMATARFVLVIPFFIYVGASPTQFFTYQLTLAFIEVIILIGKTYRLLPVMSDRKSISWEWAPIRKVLRFSLTIAFASLVWILVTQTDKLLLSRLLSLADYGYFTLAVMVASGVMVIGGPISVALLPRMTKLVSQGDSVGVIDLYRSATHIAGSVAIPVALMLGLFPEQILLVWTGDFAIAQNAARVLSLYALGNAILTLAGFPYYLQCAKGDLKLHVVGSFMFVFLFVPILIWATLQFGAVGAGYAWITTNIVYIVLWVPRIHKRLEGDLLKGWFVEDVLKFNVRSMSFLCVVGAVIQIFHLWPGNRMMIGAQLFVVGAVAGLLSLSKFVKK